MSETAQKFQQEQEEYWNGPGAENWLASFDVVDQLLVPFQERVLAAAAAQPGETIIDIGCGTGGTTLALAETAGPNGRVIGVDISVPLIDEARRRADAAGVSNVTFEVADAGTHPFDAQSVDLIFSRFGVMFFGDPYGAFENIRKGMKDSGRLTFVCWQEMAKNPFFVVPIGAALEVVPPPEPMPPRAPGPFAFGEKDYIHDILNKVGFHDITIDGLESRVPLPEAFDPKSAAEFYVSFGPTKRLLQDQPDEMADTVRTKIEEALSRNMVDGKISLGGAVWIVQASK